MEPALAIALVGLISVLRALVARKGELDKEYFGNFIQPAWEAFLSVHEDYKASFREYVELADKDDCSIRCLIERIRQDSVFASDLRHQLSEITRWIPSATGKTKDEHLLAFVQAIVHYLFSRYSFIHGAGMVWVVNEIPGTRADVEDILRGMRQGSSSRYVGFLSTKRRGIGLRQRILRLLGLHRRDLAEPLGYSALARMSNPARDYTVELLQLVESDALDRHQARQFLTEVSRVIQMRYGEVADAYNQLRASLLS